MNLDKFACFVLCHGRPHKTPTISTLRRCGYTGKIYIILDDGDDTIIGYKNYFPDCELLVFNKAEVLQTFDIMDNQKDDRCAVFARNACFQFAKKLGIEYFCELDDDYITIVFRWLKNDTLYRIAMNNSGNTLDRIFENYIEFLESNADIYSVAFAQPGDYIGGSGSALIKSTVRQKCMNSWICKTDRFFKFMGRMNDDVNTYIRYGSLGKMFFTFDFVMIDQPATQSESGGMTDMYSGNGTYMKSFYSVILCPSFVKIDMMGDRHYRIHHNIDWEHAVPKIVSGSYKKS